MDLALVLRTMLAPGCARALPRRRQAVAAHDVLDRLEVGRAAGSGVDDLAHLTEVGRPEKAGGGDGEEAGVGVAAVDEAVDGAARDEDRLAGADVVVGALDGEGDGAG